MQHDVFKPKTMKTANLVLNDLARKGFIFMFADSRRIYNLVICQQ